MSSAASSSGRSFTSAQEDAIQRVFDCDATAYYAILGVAEDADSDEIKRAFKSLALLLHPDKNAAPQAEEAFKIVRQAWEVLSDDQERAAYDNERRGGFSSFFSGSYTSDDSWSRSSARPQQQQQKPRRNENRKQRRRRDYEERMARQRRQEEQRASADAEELLRRFAREAGRRGIRFWYCRQCDDVHFEGDVHVQSQHGHASQSPRREPDEDGGLYEALFTLIVMAAGLLLVLYALYYGLKFLFTSTFGKIVLGIVGIMTVLYFVPDPNPPPAHTSTNSRPTPRR